MPTKVCCPEDCQSSFSLLEHFSVEKKKNLFFSSSHIHKAVLVLRKSRRKKRDVNLTYRQLNIRKLFFLTIFFRECKHAMDLKEGKYETTF